MDIRKILLCAIGGIIAAGTGCSDNQAVRLRYEAERQLYPLEKRRSQIVRNRQSDPTTVRELAAGYRAAVEFCTAALDSIDQGTNGLQHSEVTHLAFSSYTGLSQLYFFAHRYDSAAAILSRLSQNIALNRTEKLTTELNLGRALQASGNWDSALIVYHRLVDSYYPPVDDSGGVRFDLFNLPYRIYRITRRTEDVERRETEAARVEAYYRRLTNDFPDSRLEVAGRSNLARFYQDGEQWEKAVRELTALSESGNNKNVIVRMKIADIIGSRLDRYQDAMDLYEEISASVDKADSLDYPLIRFKISIVLMAQKKHREARRILVEIKEDYPYFFARTPLAQLTMARTFEYEGNWNRARAEYSYLIEQYPSSDEALSAPLHMAEHYSRIDRQSEADHWLAEAEILYDRALVRGAGTILEAKTLIFKADLNIRKNDQIGAIAILTELFGKFPGTEPGRRALVSAAKIYREELDNPKAADSLMNVLRATLVESSGDFEI